MSPSKDNVLLLKLDEFIRRYYKNRLIRGSLYACGIVIAAFLTVALLEYFGQFGRLVRGILFIGFVASAVVVLARYVVAPLLKLYRIGPVISYDEAARIIGRHFTNVQDKLLNVLQLRSGLAMHMSDDLLLAGIDQKIEELRPVSFASAIDLRENRRYLKYALPPVLLTFLIAILWPRLLTTSTERLVNYSTYYEKRMPFSFHLLNAKMTALQTEDFRLSLELRGNEIPNEVFVEVNGIEYKLEKETPVRFHHTFTNLQGDLTFRLSGAGYYSREYMVKVLPKPSLQQFNVQLVFPAYLKRAAEQVQNTGDLQLPEGTRVTWTFNTKNTEVLRVHFTDTVLEPKRVAEDQFLFSRSVFSNDRYTLRPANRFVQAGSDSVSYAINVLPDRVPAIEVSEKADSLQQGMIYFSGQIRDDYGFTSLVFHHKRTSRDSTGKLTETSGSQRIEIDRSKVTQPYFHFFDASGFNLSAGEKVDYYFEVFDNDGVHGPKSARTQMMAFRAPTREELSEAVDKSNSEIKKDLEESIKKASQLQKEISDLARKMNDKQQLGYEDKKSLQELMKKQAELQQKIEDLKKQNEQSNKQQNEFNPMDESILEKQKQLEQLFENVMTPEMKKLFDELNKMLERLDKNQVQEKLEELKLTNKDIEKELDRNLEAFKQLELQQKMQEAIDKLDELQKKQEELKNQTEGKTPKDNTDKRDKEAENKDKKEGEKPGDDLKKQDESKDNKGDKKGEQKPGNKDLEKKQDELNKEFEQLKKDLAEMKEKNQALEEPVPMPETGKKEEEISKEMQNSSEKLSQGNKKSASQSQQKAGEKMQEMKEEMEQAMADAEEQQEEDNAQALRQILENLLNLSFSQEDLMKDLRRTRIDNPHYVDIPKSQNKLRDNSKLIEDSLLALSKRSPQVSAIVNREISAINLNMEKTVKHLADRNTGESLMRMQSTMKSVNDLALLLNESLEQMQKQMQQKKNNKGQKGGSCKKPGSGSGQASNKQPRPLSNMRQMQEQLNKQLQELKEALEKGQKPGEKPGEKPGQKPGKSGPNGSFLPGSRGGSSEQFAKMAAQQEALRRQMEQLMNNMKNKGRQPGGNLADLMEQTERDLVNKRLSSETMRRQQEILTRLLESEKAEREREQDEQRKSTESKIEISGNPEQFLEYKRLKQKEMELLNTVPPSLTPFYKEKVNNYFNQLNSK